MAECQFNIEFTGTASSLLARAKEVIEKKEGRFSGDEEKGEFEISFMGMAASGAYTVIGNELQVQILSKPFFIPCETVENYFRHKLLDQ